VVLRFWEALSFLQIYPIFMLTSTISLSSPHLAPSLSRSTCLLPVLPCDYLLFLSSSGI